MHKFRCYSPHSRYVVTSSELLFGQPTVPHSAKPALSFWDRESATFSLDAQAYRDFQLNVPFTEQRSRHEVRVRSLFDQSSESRQFS
jgi:hypothetical protein